MPLFVSFGDSEAEKVISPGLARVLPEKFFEQPTAVDLLPESREISWGY